MALTTAVIGLGSMGFGMGQSLLRAGHRVFAFDVNERSVEALVEQGAETAPTMASAGAQIDVVVVVVLNAQQLSDVLFGEDGIVASMGAGTCVIACPTVPPNVARDMEARCREEDVLYLDAPISGGSIKAANGQLSVMASGSRAAFERSRPILDTMAETVFELGDSAGAGSAMKAINQLLAGVHIACMAEAITFGITQDIDPAQTVDVISQCAGTSWMFENRGPHIVAGDYTPHSAVNIWPKDLGIVLEIAKASGFEAPLAQTALQQFAAAAAFGLGAEDDAAVAKVYAKRAGLPLPGESA